MPRKKNEATTVVIEEEEPIIEEKPRKHIVQVWKRQSLPEYNTHIDIKVGEIIYWESTDDITYSFEAGYQIYMDNFVNRAIKVDKKWFPRENTRLWMENLPFATFDEGYFAGEVLTLYEIE